MKVEIGRLFVAENGDLISPLVEVLRVKAQAVFQTTYMC
jgi:hypothetical protein